MVILFYTDKAMKTMRQPRPYAPTTSAILSVLKRIPKGKIAAYGQVAALAGQPGGARQVVRILHALSEREKLPWWRVVNRLGEIALPKEGAGNLQVTLLKKEGVVVDAEGKVDLTRYSWKPG